MVQNETLPLVAVIGATGRQGSSVVNTLVESGQYRVRALTRAPQTNKAKEWVKYYTGVGHEKKLLETELIQFDASNESTYEAALKDVDYLYAMTNQDLDNADKEYENGKKIADGAKKYGVKHVIWSSQPNVEKISGGKLKAPQLTNKARVEDYMKEIGLSYTAVVPGYFLENITEQKELFGFKPDQKTEGGHVLKLPIKGDTKIPILHAREDTGPAVLKVLNHKDQMGGKESPIFSEELSMNEIAKHYDENARFEYVEGEKLKALPMDQRDPKLPDSVIDMFMFWDQYGYFGGLRSSAGAKASGEKGVSKAKAFFDKHRGRVGV